MKTVENNASSLNYKGDTLASDRVFTPIQRRIMNVFMDGLPHRKEEICMAVWDEYEESTVRNLHNHLDEIRKILRPKGQDIICQFVQKQMQYRLIMLMSNPNNGKI